MLNYLYLYGIVWSITLILYSFGWSDYCIPLATEIKVFLIISIAISFILGYIFRKKFIFKRIDKFPKRTSIITIGVVLFAFLEYIVCHQIPLIGIITGSNAYTSFDGIPTLHVINSTIASFYSQYLFYLFLCFKNKKKLLIEYASLLIFVHLFEFNRGGLLISVFISAILYFSSIAHKIKFKHILFGTVFLIVVLYIFGGLGNIRETGSWNADYLGIYGGFNSKFPSWLPNQFKWPYLYMVCSLWNLTYILNQISIDFVGFVSTFLPDFITKRIMPSFGSKDAINLLVISFTTYSGYGTTLLYGGIAGMYVKFAFLMGINGIILKVVSKDKRFFVPTAGIIAAIVTMFFFTNTISYSAISFPIVYPFIISILRKKESKKYERYSFSGRIRNKALSANISNK